jgi:hypothetical protein
MIILPTLPSYNLLLIKTTMWVAPRWTKQLNPCCGYLNPHLWSSSISMFAGDVFHRRRLIPKLNLLVKWPFWLIRNIRISTIDSFPQVIKHGLLENLPFFVPWFLCCAEAQTGNQVQIPASNCDTLSPRHLRRLSWLQSGVPVRTRIYNGGLW